MATYNAPILFFSGSLYSHWTASPYDKIWGIGLSESDPRAQNPQQWQGENWLGQVLETVRKSLKMAGL